MELVTVCDAHIAELMRWFPDADSCATWAGPDFRFPFTDATFREDLRLTLPSLSLVDSNAELLAFGQYYLRAGRCHLARLAVRPRARGQGLGRKLIARLSRIGRRNLQVSDCSLFVFEDNAPARRLYERLGFAPAVYPEENLPQVQGMLYMVASSDAVDAWERC